MTATPPARAILVDAHVHLHDCFPLGRFLDAAHRNFSLRARGADFDGVLLLTEGGRDDAFARLARGASDGAWRTEPTGEAVSVRARADDGRTLFVVAGRQVAAAEDLEVLLLATDAHPPDGLPIRKVLDIATERRALHAIPWGPGKWFFARGKLVSELLRSASPTRFFLGDESARPGFWRTPRHFVEARARGIRVLRGTDPLPFPREVTRAGSYGFRLTGPAVGDRPAGTVAEILADPATLPDDFGSRETPLAFVRNQWAMQLRKRARRARRG